MYIVPYIVRKEGSIKKSYHHIINGTLVISSSTFYCMNVALNIVAYLISLMAGRGFDPWIGLKKAGRSHLWADNHDVTYTNWGSGQPVGNPNEVRTHIPTCYIRNKTQLPEPRLFLNEKPIYH